MDNPFIKFVAAAYDDVALLQLDVPTIHADIRAALESVVKRYCDSAKTNAVLSSGLLVVAGRPGAGKSHLRAVFAREGASSPPRVVVTPGTFDANQNFQEYLLHQLVSHLKQEVGSVQPQGARAVRGSLARIADRLTREAALEILRSASEPEWHAVNATKPLEFWKTLLGFQTSAFKVRREQMVATLTGEGSVDWAKLCEKESQSLDALQSFVVAKIAASGGVASLPSRVRAGLHASLAKAAFSSSQSTLFDFLANGFSETATPVTGGRAAFVQELLRALVELYLWAGEPIVFLFDAMETLLNDPPDQKSCEFFFRGVTDLVDQVPGVPVVLLVESGHWERACQHRASHTTDRFKQGIPCATEGGPHSDLKLGPVTLDQLQALVETRMHSTLIELERRAGCIVEPYFPFKEAELEKMWQEPESDRYSLRRLVERLRDRYQEIVNERDVAPVDKPVDPPPEGPPKPPLPPLWKSALARAKKQLSSSGADEAHAGMLVWLTALAEKRRRGPQTAVRNPETVYFSENPSYGQLTRFQLETHKSSISVGVGFLFGVGVGLSSDLRVKLNMMAASERLVERLILLWPKEGLDDLALWRRLPPTSQSVWKTLAKRTAVELRTATPQLQTAFLALPWFQQQARERFTDLPEAEIHSFIAELETPTLRLIVPTGAAS